MAQDNDWKVLVKGDLAVSQRTFGGLLGQLEAVEMPRADAVEILRSAGLPASAYDDPGFPLSIEQDFEILNDIRKHLWTQVSMEVGVFGVALVTRAHMFGALGLAYQTAPTVLDAIRLGIAVPHINWGRSRMVLEQRSSGERIRYELTRVPSVFSRPEELAATCKYALLLDVSVGAALILDMVSDRSMLRKVCLPFPEPQDWARVGSALEYPVEFDADGASIEFKRGFSEHVPRKSHRMSFKLAMKLVENESKLLAVDVELSERVKRWLWSETPPLKKAEVAKRLGMAERTLTRQLARDGVTFNELLVQVQSERSKNFLSNPALTISEVAYRVGYSDPAAFTRAFTSWCGVSPSEWRLGGDEVREG